jgi:DNA ligase (NAD+)
MRRGGVIPYLEAVVEPGDGEIRPPEACPSCGAPTRIEGDFVFCSNVDGCVAKRVGVLAHFANVADIEGFGQVWLETLLERGLLRTPADFYALTVEDLIQFDRMGDVLAGKLVWSVNSKRALDLATFLQALGVPDLGRTASATLATQLLSLKAIRAAEPLDLVDLPKFGELLAGKIVAGLAACSQLIDALLVHVTVPDEPERPPENAPTGPLAGQSFLFTGTLASMKRADAQERIEALGGTNASGVSKKLTYLVVGSRGKAGSKLQKAEKAGVQVLPEADFAQLLAAAEAPESEQLTLG